MTMKILLVGGDAAIVDDEDYERLRSFRWRLKIEDGRKYAVWNTTRAGRQVCFRMHSLVLGTKLPIDHKDRNGLNNTKSNLRLATKSQNAANSKVRRDNISGFRGVSPLGKRWRSVIQVNGRRLHLGCYTTAIDAAIAYDLAAIRFFEEFARTNVIGEVVAC